MVPSSHPQPMSAGKLLHYFVCSLGALALTCKSLLEPAKEALKDLKDSMPRPRRQRFRTLDFASGERVVYGNNGWGAAISGVLKHEADDTAATITGKASKKPRK